jgi:hypothetical protein
MIPKPSKSRSLLELSIKSRYIVGSTYLAYRSLIGVWPCLGFKLGEELDSIDYLGKMRALEQDVK